MEDVTSLNRALQEQILTWPLEESDLREFLVGAAFILKTPDLADQKAKCEQAFKTIMAEENAELISYYSDKELDDIEDALVRVSDAIVQGGDDEELQVVIDKFLFLCVPSGAVLSALLNLNLKGSDSVTMIKFISMYLRAYGRSAWRYQGAVKQNCWKTLSDELERSELERSAQLTKKSVRPLPLAWVRKLVQSAAKLETMFKDLEAGDELFEEVVFPNAPEDDTPLNTRAHVLNTGMVRLGVRVSSPSVAY